MTTDLQTVLLRLDAIEKSNTHARLWDYAFKALVPIVVALGATHIAHEVRLAKLEERQFTKADASSLEQRLTAIITPPIYRDSLIAEIRSLGERMRALELKLGAIELRLK